MNKENITDWSIGNKLSSHDRWLISAITGTYTHTIFKGIFYISGRLASKEKNSTVFYTYFAKKALGKRPY